MNDNWLSWAISGLGGLNELISKMADDRTKIQSDKVQRFVAEVQKLVATAKKMTDKSE